MFSLTSCEEVININLNSTEPKVVIEGFITDNKSPLLVKITKSQDYFNQSPFLPVNSANVIVKYQDRAESLMDKGDGNYYSINPIGIFGNTYTLDVTIPGNNFTGTVELPPPVPIDTVYFKQGVFKSDSLNIFVEFHDPAKTENFYRLIIFRNRFYAINDYYLTNDAFTDGEKVVLPVYYRYFAPKDTVIVELLNLEKNTYKYLKGLSENIRQGVNSNAPGNPPTNLTGGALGIFGAFGTSAFRIIIP